MNVPLLDLRPQLAGIREEILEAVTGVIDSTRYILGPSVTEFEQAAASYLNVPEAVGVSSGTDALLASLMSLGIGPGDRVVTTPFSFFATMGVILRVGAIPVFADVEPDSLNIDPEKIAELAEEQRKKGKPIKAIIPVHLYGQCADMKPIQATAREHDAYIIEDAAQSIGAEYPCEDGALVRWKKSGSMGDAGCFSFFPSKNLGCLGDGGLVTTADPKLAETLRSNRNHGADPKYYHSRVGGNFRLAAVQAAVLSVKLQYLESWHRQRRKNAQTYMDLFTDIGLADNPVSLPQAVFSRKAEAEKHNYHIYNQFVIQVPQRDQLRKHLAAQSIGCEIYYPLCLHQQECLKEYSLSKQPSCPVAEEAAKKTLALPIYPELSDEQLRHVVEQIKAFYH
ncbi:MAG: transcriptional regulator [Desulfobulbus propionicus]|nr:MAG: transcriptional regulator [Desulfobulbus propionicus]